MAYDSKEYCPTCHTHHWMSQGCPRREGSSAWNYERGYRFCGACFSTNNPGYWHTPDNEKCRECGKWIHKDDAYPGGLKGVCIAQSVGWCKKCSKDLEARMEILVFPF